MIFIGIDPGLDGAVAAIAPEQVDVFDTPTTQVTRNGKNRRDYLVAQMADLLQKYAMDECSAVIEAVHSMPKQGVASSFSFGRGAGLWEGILAALRIPFSKVAPQTWKKAMLADTGKEKGDARIRASQLFPQVAEQFKRSKDDGRAESLLMAAYGQRLYSNGTPSEANNN